MNEVTLLQVRYVCEGAEKFLAQPRREVTLKKYVELYFGKVKETTGHLVKTEFTLLTKPVY